LDKIKREISMELKNRKVLIAAVVFATATGLLGIGALTATLWVELTKWILIIFAGGNGFEHAASAYKTKPAGE
jgi:hypothetical protein